MMLSNFLETKNLILKVPNPKMYNSAHLNIFTCPECAENMLWRLSETLADTTNKINSWLEVFNSGLTYFIFEKGNPLNVVGFVFANIANGVLFDLGLCFGKDYFGKGYGKEVMLYLIEKLNEVGVNKIEYSCFKRNIASNKLAQNLGFNFVKSEELFVKKFGETITQNIYELKLN